MEDNKYYTPTIDEFGHGFQYEIKLEGPNNLKSGTSIHWIPFTFGAGPFGNTFAEVEDYLIKGIVRVPYLSKEDIQAEGWELEEQGKGVQYYRKGKYTLEFDSRDHSVEIQFNGYEDKIRFCGKIKNASEFKRILKMIGV